MINALRPSRPATVGTVLAAFSAGLLPLAVAVAWIPLRRSLPNTDVALVLVATIAPVARLGGHVATGFGSVSAALSFGYFHTEPYGHWQIAHARDVETTVLIVLVGVFVGELTLRVFHHRAAAARGSADLAVLAETAELMAVGDDPGLVLGAVAGELVRLLDLADCEFSAEPPSRSCPWVGRDGILSTAAAPGAAGGAPGLDLPVWVQGQVLGHYRMTLRPGAAPAPDRLALAVSLADQAGAALAVAPPDPPWYPGAERHLRLVGPAPDPGPRTPAVRRSGGSVLGIRVRPGPRRDRAG
ncbi:MAG TPA: DUF4118 domain-containing protein [Acidimicrobiales bacterium]|nr:DUF4118 domain-containing protein [Acidimicrobiales bacterium]